MPEFKVSWEINIEANNPLEAAANCQDWLEDPQNNWQFYVQNEETKEIFSVDFEEEVENSILPVTNYTPFIVQKLWMRL